MNETYAPFASTRPVAGNLKNIVAHDLYALTIALIRQHRGGHQGGPVSCGVTLKNLVFRICAATDRQDGIFECGDVLVTWDRWIGRGMVMPDDLTAEKWDEVMKLVEESL